MRQHTVSPGQIRIDCDFPILNKYHSRHTGRHSLDIGTMCILYYVNIMASLSIHNIIKCTYLYDKKCFF